ncbi:ABC transporter [Phytophthora megakarya]|uniref:ABC transporter n=1 Tax=Phytophthora megakarya TaxID=4795 RepID=A0A225VEV4_9STRA|nr:ABC transporter [Phytophthora megakarya]
MCGGEHKRVTGAMEFGNKHAEMIDEVGTGLNRAAIFGIITTQRNSPKKRHKTVLGSVSQQSSEAFELFHDVVIPNEGQMMYYRTHTENVWLL